MERGDTSRAPKMPDGDRRRWWACAFPERLPDWWMTYHYGNCDPCAIKAAANGDWYPTPEHIQHLKDEGLW